MKDLRGLDIKSDKEDVSTYNPSLKINRNILKKWDLPENTLDSYKANIERLKKDKENLASKPEKEKRKAFRRPKNPNIVEAKSKRDFHGLKAKLETVLNAEDSSISPMLPISLDLTVYGNTYLNVGDMILINFLPSFYLDNVFFARIIFGSCCLVMIISVIFFIRDIFVSTETLKLHLSDMKIDLD